MINSSLTVEENLPKSHLEIWKNFFILLVRYIEYKKDKRIHWLLLGREAKKFQKTCSIDQDRCIFAVHPSPLSADRGFFGSKIFSKIKLGIPKTKIFSENFSLFIIYFYKNFFFVIERVWKCYFGDFSVFLHI